jgi:nicotinamidase-related amidase
VSGTKHICLKTRFYRWYPAEAHEGFTEEEVRLELSRTALVVVDAYLPGADAGGGPPDTSGQLSPEEYQVKREIAVRHIGPSLRAARAAGMPVIFVTNSAPNIGLEQSEYAQQLARAQGFAMSDDFAEEGVDPREYRAGAPRMIQFDDAVRPQPGDLYIRKHAYSGFYATRLEAALRYLDARNLLFAGFRLDACLGSTMLDALARNFKVILLRDCTLACELPDELAERSFTRRMLIWFENLVGVSVESVDFIRACEDFRNVREQSSGT